MPQAKSFIKESITIIILALVIVLPIRIFIAQPFVVSGDSMDNTFQNGNYLIVDEISYRFEAPKRGDVVIFKAPPKALALEKQNANKTIFYIKRIIGLPGETVEVSGDNIKIYNSANPDGFELNESYEHFDPSVASGTSAAFKNIHEKITLGAGQYFVLGDNRHNSSDSRLWGILPKENIKGRAFMELFPLNQISVFPGEYSKY